MKCFERLVMAHINSSLPAQLDPLQFADQCNRSIADAISLALHSSLEHLDNKVTCIRLLLIDCSFAFNTIIPSRLISKLRDLGLSSTLCNRILSFLTHRLQSVRIDNCTSSTITLNTGSSQGCVLSPLLHSLYSHNCVAKFQMNAIYKFADDTTMVGQLSNNNMSEYRKETEGLVMWCNNNNFSLNVGKTKQLIIDFRKKGGEYTLIDINGAEFERVEIVKFLGMTITDNLPWTSNVDATAKKAQQCLFFLRWLRKYSMSIRSLINFYRCTIE
eukprot:g20281.t1